MNIRHSIKSEAVAAFLLGGLIALLITTPVRSAEPFRLDRISIVRFTPTADGRLLMQNGVLELAGEVTWRGTQDLARPAHTPAWALNRHLVPVQAWHAFNNLGGEATADFALGDGDLRALIGENAYFAVEVSPTARTSNGRLVNLSTRTTLSGGDVVIAGFVLEERPRTILVRAVGPSLARFGVGSPHPDPWLTVKRGSQSLVGNDDWSNQANADRVSAAAARVGAFPLDMASFDAAVLITLPPGAYTVHVGSDLLNVRSRDVLVEVYVVPEDVLDALRADANGAL